MKYTFFNNFNLFEVKIIVLEKLILPYKDSYFISNRTDLGCYLGSFLQE